MSIQIENKLHAHATFTLANPPVLIRGDNVQSVQRNAVGVYVFILRAPLVTTLGPLVIGSVNWFAVHNLLPGAGNVAKVKVTVNIPNTQVLCSCYNAAGALSDGGMLQVALFRLPTVGLGQ